MPMRYPAVKFRRKIYVAGPRHQDAVNLAFKGMSPLSRRRAQDRIAEGKEIGFACEDGTDWYLSSSQSARTYMYFKL